MKTFYIGLSTTYHDPSIAIVNDKGKVVFAEATERYLQYKKALSCPPDSYARMVELIKNYCDPNANFVISTSWHQSTHNFHKDLFNSGYFDPKKYLTEKFTKITKHLAREYLISWSVLQHFSTWITAGSSLTYNLKNKFNNNNIRFQHFDHHLSHATYACFSSPFDKALCMVVDGHGDTGRAMSYYYYEQGKLKPIKGTGSNDSLGTFYSTITDLCGFDSRQGEEWKVMGLAPYGKLNKEIYHILKKMVRTEKSSLKFSSPRVLIDCMKRLQKFKRLPSEPPLHAADLAFTGQRIFSEMMDQLIANLYQTRFSNNLILTGGCALNSSYNGTILDNSQFKKLFIPSAPADDGNSLGAAWLSYTKDNPSFIPNKKPLSPYLGSKISDFTLTNLLKHSGLKIKHSKKNIHRDAARILAQGKIIGFFQGPAEFGPRALGNRSILADPRPKSMKDSINAKVKYREEFRPFAPSILHEFGDKYFLNYQETPYMDRTLIFRDEVCKSIPAVVHFNKTGRLQSVKKEWNKNYYELIHEFYKITGVPLLLNTSFNIMGKPIVHSIEDALSVFFTAGLDALVIEDYLLTKK